MFSFRKSGKRVEEKRHHSLKNRLLKHFLRDDSPHRSDRSGSASDDSPDAETTTTSLVVRSEQQVEPVVAKPVPLIVESDTVHGTAYHEAWLALDADQKAELANDKSVGSLFDELRKTDKSEMEKSLFRKGLSAAAPALKKISTVLDLASPFVSLNVPAGTALGLVQGSISIVVAICGAVDQTASHIDEFLRHIPAMDRCDGVSRDGSQFPDIHHTLVNMYKALLEFYLKTIAVLKGSHLSMTISLARLDSEASGILSNFNTYAETLDILLRAETFASTQEIKQDIIEALIRDTLNDDRDGEEAWHNQLARRSEEACLWIESAANFTSWASPEPENANRSLFVLSGNMGCGKTMTVAHVVGVLEQHRLAVCCYYCKDSTTTNLGSIYRSILWQLLRQKPELKYRYAQWHKLEPSHVEPARSEAKLRQFLVSALLSSSQYIYVVLDALDECDVMDRRVLLELFRELFQKNARIKLFLSLREDAELDSVFPEDASTRVAMNPTRERDRVLARYLVEALMPTKVPEEIIEALAERAEGSAIWLRIAIQYLQKVHISSRRNMDLDMALKKLPASSDLVHLYSTLFEKMCDDDMDNRQRLQLALEALAVARRPLRLYELSYVVFLGTVEGPEDVDSIPSLDDRALSVDLLDLVRPFVSIIESTSEDDNPTLRLVHQSLKELIMSRPPDLWHNPIQQKQVHQLAQERAQDLNEHMLRCCIQYLLLRECDEISLMDTPPDLLEENDVFTSMALGGLEDVEDDGATEASLAPAQEFSPAALGLGHFFAYAAAYWTDHFFHVSPQRHQPAVRDLILLCRPGSQRLRNWVYQSCRPRCTRAPDSELAVRQVDMDPLVVTAMFGPVAYIADLLEVPLEPPAFVKDSIWTALAQLTIRGEAAGIQWLLENPYTGSLLHHIAFFYAIVPSWSAPASTRHQQAKTDLRWEVVFDLAIQHLLLTDGGIATEYTNEILCEAARSGCLVLAQRLFKAAETDVDMRDKLLSVSRHRHRETISMHQSVGLAVWENHTEVVEFLCRQQPRIQGHLQYKNAEGHTVFHQWARRANPKIFHILMQYWPEGVHLRNHNGDSPLHLYIFDSGDHTEDRMMETLHMLITMGHVDASGRADDAWHTPLRMAARAGKAKVCRFLVTEGQADLYSVLGIDKSTGQPILLESVNLAGEAKMREEARLLAELLSLAPVTVLVKEPQKA